MEEQSVKILHRYILSTFLKNFGICLLGFLFLFLVFDFMDRIDNVINENASAFTIALYFIYKIPMTVTLMLPIAMLVSTLLTFGILSKNSEITAMRSAGVKVTWLAKPVLISGLIVSLICLLLNETLVPISTQRVKEIYNIDIKQKDKKGGYSENDLWWRSGNIFYSVGMFDSRIRAFLDLVKIDTDEDFKIAERLNADRALWINSDLGWTMEGVTEYDFSDENTPKTTVHRKLPLPIAEQPKDFFEFATDPYTMSFKKLRKFIHEQKANGLAVSGYYADLYEKIAFPFVNFIVVLVSLPFALKPARTGNMAASFLAGLVIGFSYYAVHSFSVAMGRAEMYPAFLAAWMANILLGVIGVILNLGSESPSGDSGN